MEDYGDNEDETAVDIDLCSEDVPSLIRASRSSNYRSIIDILVSSSVTVFSDSNRKNDLQHFHAPFLHLDAVQDVVITLCDKHGSL